MAWNLGLLGAASFVPPVEFALLQDRVLAQNELSIVFLNVSSYAQDFRHLQIRGTVRTSRPSSLDDVQLRFNGDSGANYSAHNLQANGNDAVASSGQGASSSMSLAYSPGNTNTASSYSGFIADILDPFNANKGTTVLSQSGMADSNWSLSNLFAGGWYNNSVINQITLYSSQGSSFVPFTRFSLYGMK